MFAEHSDYINPELEGSSHPFPWFSLSPDEAKVGKLALKDIYSTIHSPKLKYSQKHNLQMERSKKNWLDHFKNNMRNSFF